RQTGRDHRRPGADLRRHQPRRHQGPRVLHRGTQAARAHEDPGDPRRPARYRHLCFGRLHQWPESSWQAHGQDQVGALEILRRAAALACLNLIVDLGVPIENIWVTDIEGVVYEGRTVLMDPDKARFAQKTDKRTLAEVIEGADVFLGLSAGGVLKPEMVKTMAP